MNFIKSQILAISILYIIFIPILVITEKHENLHLFWSILAHISACILGVLSNRIYKHFIS